MKRIMYHWIEMRTVEVPDECPAEYGLGGMSNLLSWMYDNKGEDNYIIKKDTRDYEIVDIEEVNKNVR